MGKLNLGQPPSLLRPPTHFLLFSFVFLSLACCFWVSLWPFVNKHLIRETSISFNNKKRKKEKKKTGRHNEKI